jgi:hypothetical protein
VIDQDNIARQVLRNCEISDARHAGLFSICGLALRLRDLYKWEKGLDPWVEKDSSQILDWIGNKEEEWEKIAETQYLNLSITINGREYDPFDTTALNAILEPHNLFYGAGYARSLKPTFFLAAIEEKSNARQYPVFTLGRELARDLLTIPALTQNNAILWRKESARMYLWDQILYIKKSGRQALRFALEQCGLKDQRPKTLHRNLATILAAQKETYIYHELGEIMDTVFDRTVWREVIAAYPHTPVELLTRAVKDLLADTNEFGTLRNFIRKRKASPIAFYVAFIDGLAKILFADLVSSFHEFAQTGNWKVIESAVDAGFQNAKDYAEQIITIHTAGKQKENKDWAQKEIENRLIDNLVPIKTSSPSKSSPQP